MDDFDNRSTYQTHEAILLLILRINGCHDGDIKFSTPLLIPKAGGFGVTAI